MKTATLLRCWLVLLFAWGTAPVWAQALEIIELRNRPAEQVLPIVRPMLDPGGTIGGNGFTLFVRTTPANLAQLRQVIASVDRAARQLTISVRQDAEGRSERSAAGAQVILSPGNSQVRGGIEDRSGSSRDNVSQQIRAQEGTPAYISSGTSVPVAARTVTRTVNGVIVQETVTPQNINTGFYVTPRVNGDTVFLDISTQRDTPGQFGPGSANTNRIATTVSGKLGSWIDLGGIDQSQSSESRGILSRERGSSAVARGVQVRVEEAR